MQKIFQKLENLNLKSNSKVKKALISLINNGYARTGESGYNRGWIKKYVYTKIVEDYAKEIGLKVESGNDAPRGGANGEFVRLVSDKRKNKKVWKNISDYSQKLKDIQKEKEKIIADRDKVRAEKQSVISKELDKIKPILENFKDSYLETKKLSGIQKSEAQSALFTKILDQAAVKTIDFWQLWRMATKYLNDKLEIKNHTI